MSIDVEALLWAEHLVDVHGPYGSDNATPCEHARDRIDSPERIRNILAEYARLVPAEDEGLSVHINDGSAHDRAMAWSEGHTAGFEEGRAAAAEDEGRRVSFGKTERRPAVWLDDAAEDEGRRPYSCDPPTTHRYDRIGADVLRCRRCGYEKAG